MPYQIESWHLRYHSNVGDIYEVLRTIMDGHVDDRDDYTGHRQLSGALDIKT